MAEENVHVYANKPCSANGLDKLVKKIDDSGDTDRPNGSGRP